MSKEITRLIGIGASAGGLEAIHLLFDKIPTGTEAAYVIIQHLSPDHKSLMPELLSKHTDMEIFTAEDKQALKPNCIYLNQSRKNLHVKGDKLYLLDKGPKQNINLPIDIFFHTLGEEWKEKSIGVILSGTGSDGSRGIKSIKESGGLIIVQSPGSAQFNGMPNATIATGLADFVMDPENIGLAISQYPQKRLETILTNQTEEEIFITILKEVQKLRGIDFTLYKRNTLMRRLEKRIHIHQVDSLKSYLDIFQREFKERELLLQDFLIGVTSFFRDTDSFKLLQNNVFPLLCADRDPTIPLRIWVPGCSTGEEAYSIAMALDHYIAQAKLDLNFKLFATDVDEQALLKAGIGSYSTNAINEMDKMFLDRYFVKSGDQIQIIKRIRDKIIFSINNIINDPPFIRIDLISCRNVLIYLNNEAQETAISNFLFSLNRKGFLFMGQSESLGKLEEAFIPMDPKQKIYQSAGQSSKYSTARKVDGLVTTAANLNLRAPFGNNQVPEYSYYKYVSEKYGPSLLFIDDDFNILFTKGLATKKLNPKDGLFKPNILQMVDQRLATIIRNGVRRVKSIQKPVLVEDISFNSDDPNLVTNLVISKAEVSEGVSDCYLMEFGEEHESEVPEPLENLDFSDITSQRIEDLEYELKLKNDELKNLIEELETSNEELQSSNEELTASNEELQSTNEELQSVNEELHTVNSELREKNNELQQVYYDLNHLYDTQDIATLFLDHELRIRSYTPAVTSHLSLKKSDIGRPISNFMFFDQPVRELFFREAKASVTDGKHFQETILNEDKHYLIKISPFVKEDVIDGVVITLIDVEEVAIVKDKYQKLFESTSLALQMDQMAFWEWSVERDEVVNQNDYWLELFELDSRKIRLQLDKKLHEEDKKEVWDVINKGVLRNEPYAHEFRIWNNDHTSVKWIKNRGKVIRRGKYGEPLRMLCISKDITKEKSGELELIHAKEQAERANKQKDLFLSNLSHEIRTPMNAVVGFSKLMKKSNLKKGQKELYLEQIEENSKQLLVLINDILDLSKIESGALLLQDEETDLKKLMNDIYEYYANELEGNDTISIQLREPKDATQNTTIATDPVRLKQVINNLVDNAIKYSKKGTITLGYEFTKDKVKFEIADQGYGIEKVELERIFKRFEQLADNELQSNGAGLGLAICDGIVHAMGGTIDVKSKLGKGSTFTVTVPRKSNHTKRADMDNLESIKLGKLIQKVLIADDSPSILLYYQSVLGDKNIELLMANNGQEAVSLFEKNPDVSLVLMDLKMPVMSGEEAFHKIRKVNDQVPIIAQSAFAMNDEVQRFKEIGFSDYLTKPIDEEKLVKLLGV